MVKMTRVCGVRVSAAKEITQGHLDETASQGSVRRGEITSGESSSSEKTLKWGTKV